MLKPSVVTSSYMNLELIIYSEPLNSFMALSNAARSGSLNCDYTSADDPLKIPIDYLSVTKDPRERFDTR